MSVQEYSVGNAYRAVNVTSTTTATLLRTLVEAAIAAKSGAAKTPVPNMVLQVRIVASANITVLDDLTGDEIALASGTEKIFPVLNALDRIKVKGSATVGVEIFGQTTPIT